MNEDPRIAGILQDWRDRLDRGEEVDPERVIADHPDLAETLRAQFEAIAHVRGASTEATALRTLAADRYTSFKPAGEGGMGIVYWAIDTDLNREVAFKIIRAGEAVGTSAAPDRPTDLTPPGLGTPARRSFRNLKQRFLQEAWITSSMAHPGIVPVYELGQTREGIPYYTMRFVKGDRTLATAIEETKGKDIEERLRLLEPFLKVCDAMRYAHSRGVLHRDLKPSNIGIGEYGEVVLLDWGLAKLEGSSDPDDEDRLRAHVREYREAVDLQSLVGMVGTPGYMAPEAAVGDSAAMDERSDVYSLGVMLFEILTGRLPFEFATFGELIERLREDDAPAAREIDDAVPEALSDLCAACLSRAMDARPATVDALAGAIRTWQVEREREREIVGLMRDARAALATAEESEGNARIRALDRAVAASRRVLGFRPGHRGAMELESAIARLRERGIRERERETRKRLLRRVAVVGLATATVVTVLVAVLVDARRKEAENAREREAEQRARAEDLATYMLGDLRDELEPVGRLDLLRKVAGKALEYYESVPWENLTANDRRARGLALGNIGDVLFDSGNPADARELFRESLEIFEGLLAQEPQNEQWQRDLSVSLNRMGDALQETGELEGALDLYRQAVAIRRPLAVADGAGPMAQDDVCRSIDRVGDALSRLGDGAAALELFRESLAIRASVAEAHPADPHWQDKLGDSLVKVGDAHVRSGDISAALEMYEAALAVRERVLRNDADNAERQEALAGCVFRVGYVLQDSGDAVAALAQYERSLEIYRKLGERDPSHAGWQRNTALSLERVAEMLRRTGDPEAALECEMEALAIKKGLRARDPTNTRARHDVGNALLNVGDAAKVARNWEAALESYGEALAIARQLAEEDPGNTEWHRDVAMALFRMASVHHLIGDLDAARATYEEALGVSREAAARDATNAELQNDVALTLQRLGDVVRDDGDLEGASTRYRESVEINRALAERDPASLRLQRGLVFVLNRLSNVALKLEDGETVLACQEEAARVNRRLLAHDPGDAERLRELAFNLYYVGTQHESAGRLPDALSALREGEALHRQAMAGDPRHATEHAWWTDAYERVVLQAGDAAFVTAADHLMVAYLAQVRQDHADAVSHFAIALEDEGVRGDLEGGHLYAAACSAARSLRLERALAWLNEDLSRRRAVLAQIEVELAGEVSRDEKEALVRRRETILRHIERARTEDPALRLLRRQPEFGALFD
ncbi:MAG: tetratricopeptide repeat protein [Planctomycetota bacterium]